jgi:hypothetical protein
MSFGNIYNRLSAIYGAIIVLLIMWIFLIFSGAIIANYVGKIINYGVSLILFIFVIIIGIYLSVKIVRWSNTPQTDKPQMKKGASLFNTLTIMPNPILNIIALLVIWVFVLSITGIITSFITGVAESVVDVIGLVVACYLSYLYLQWMFSRWKKRSEQ